MTDRCEDALLILIQHCREMKQQEVRLRFLSLLLLLGIAATLLFLGVCTKASESSPTPYAQVNPCPAGDLSPTNSGCPTAGPLRIDLSSKFDPNITSGSYLQWEDELNYDSNMRAIVIPAAGHYFVYMKFILHGEQRKDFRVTLQSLSPGYPEDYVLAEARESGPSSPERFRTVFVGQLFNLLKGDRVRVFHSEGYELIHKASFGAFQT